MNQFSEPIYYSDEVPDGEIWFIKTPNFVIRKENKMDLRTALSLQGRLREKEISVLTKARNRNFLTKDYVAFLENEQKTGIRLCKEKNPYDCFDEVYLRRNDLGQ